jgi:hypothetical protein
MQVSDSPSVSSPNLYSDLKAQYQRTRSPMLKITLIVGAFLLLLYIVARTRGISLNTLTGSSPFSDRAPFYYGLMTYITLFFWAGAATTCFLGIYLIEQRSTGHRQQYLGVRAALLFGGILNLILTFDDALHIHDYVLPRLLHIPEAFAYGGYFVLLVIYLWVFWQQLKESDHLFLLIAVVCLGLSIIIDLFFDFSATASYIEDSLKLLGTVFWLTYFARYLKTVVHDRYTS